MAGNENFSLNLQNDENEQFNLEMQNEDIENFSVDFGEVVNIGGGTSDFNELENRPKYNSQEMTGETNIPAVPTKVSDLQNDSGFQTGSQVEGAISSAIAIETADRESADNGLQSQIDAITASSDVTDIVGTYADLEDYDTSTLGDNDIIKVLQDETHDDETTYYRWNKTAGTFSLIGEEGPYYTKSQTDILFATISYVDGLVGDIETALHTINNGGA